jgi:hypothetical protein
MNNRKSLFSIFLSAFVFLISLTVFADTIRLKNGSLIKGKVVTYGQQEFTIVLDLGTSSKKSNSRMTIAVEDIDSIEFDSGGSYPGTAIMSAPPVSGNRSPVRYTEPSATSTEPVSTSSPDEGSQQPAQPSPSSRSTESESVASERTVSVSATMDWTSTEIRVQRGQRVSISASGEVDLGNGNRSTPSGISSGDSKKLMNSKPTGSLIAVVGDDNDDFVFIGRGGEFTAAHNGVLFLSVNEGNLKDNSGSYLAKVKVSGK